MSRACHGITKAATQCKLPAKRGKKYCHMHLTSADISDKPNENFREALTEHENDRDTFIGSFKRIGSKPGGLTILLTNIRSPKNMQVILADHAWFNFTKGFSQLGHLNEGDNISFTARVKRYEKGYGSNSSSSNSSSSVTSTSSISTPNNGRTFDYKFNIPLNVTKL